MRTTDRARAILFGERIVAPDVEHRLRREFSIADADGPDPEYSSDARRGLHPLDNRAMTPAAPRRLGGVRF